MMNSVIQFASHEDLPEDFLYNFTGAVQVGNGELCEVIANGKLSLTQTYISSQNCNPLDMYFAHEQMLRATSAQIVNQPFEFDFRVINNNGLHTVKLGISGSLYIVDLERITDQYGLPSIKLSVAEPPKDIAVANVVHSAACSYAADLIKNMLNLQGYQRPFFNL